MEDPKWDGRFTAMAHLVASWSKDPGRRVGAVVVAPDMRAMSIGYNGFPRGLDDSPVRLGDNHARLILSVHAESNAMSQATFPLVGAALYVTYFPCHECVKVMVQRGVARLVTYDFPRDIESKWMISWEWAEAIADEAGIALVLLNPEAPA